MKDLKTLCILFVSLLVFSCSSDDDGGDSVGSPEFAATIMGGPFNNYSSVFDYYDANSDNDRVTIIITDTNQNIIRLFMNNTGGYSKGVSKEIGNVDTGGFVTAALFRDQQAQLTYNAFEGNISITEYREDPEDENYTVISGTFSIKATTNTGTEINMNGSFSNMSFFD